MKKQNNYRFYFLSLLVAFIATCMLVGCKPKQLSVNSQQSTEIYRHDKLTPVAVPGDSSKIKALFRCDSLNRVLLDGISEQKSKNMQSAFDFKDGTFSYNATTKPDSAFIPSTDYYYNSKLTITRTVYQTKTVIKTVPNHGFFWWIGLVVFIAFTAFAGFKLVTWSPVQTIFKKLFKIN